MGVYKIILAKANRSGGKTTDFAVLALLDSKANDGCETANLGAIQAQAQRCYRYMQQYIASSPDMAQFLKGEPTISRTNFVNSSSIEVLTATMSGVNSPHPQKLKMDEIELINWQIIQEALSMVQSKGEIRGTTVMGSTQKFAIGPMQRLLDQGASKGVKVFQWCTWEVMQPLPKVQSEIDEIKRVFGDELPANIAQADGYYRWEDVIEKYLSLDKEVWDIQWTCKRPDTSGLVYPRYDEVLNTDYAFHVEQNNSNKQIYVFEDFGYAKDHPDVVLLVEVDTMRQTATVFDEVYSYHKGTDEIIQLVLKQLQRHGLIESSLDLDSPLITNYAPYLSQISGWIGDPHGMTEQQDRLNKGLPMLAKADQAELYQIKNGIPLVRKFIDDRRLKFTSAVTQLRHEMMSYSKKKLADGRFSDEPEKDNDHGPDALRYGLVCLFPQLALGSFSNESEEIGSTPILPATYQDDIEYQEDSITQGLYSKTF